MKNVPRPDARTSRSLRTTTSRTPPASGRPGATPRPRNAGDDYEQFVNAAIRASRQDEARAQRRREQRRKQNIIWISGFVIVVLALILLVWATAGRRAQTPATDLAATDLAATGNATESVVEPAQPASNGVEASNGVDAGNAIGAGAIGDAGSIPVEIQVVSDATAASAKVVLLSSDTTYKIVGKSDVGTPESNDSGELSLPIAPLDGSILEVCSGDSCTGQPLIDGNTAPEHVSVEVAPNSPYTLCARDASGAVRQVALFRALVKVNRAP